jgi:hypothetical protein
MVDLVEMIDRARKAYKISDLEQVDVNLKDFGVNPQLLKQEKTDFDNARAQEAKDIALNLNIAGLKSVEYTPGGHGLTFQLTDISSKTDTNSDGGHQVQFVHFDHINLGKVLKNIKGIDGYDKPKVNYTPTNEKTSTTVEFLTFTVKDTVETLVKKGMLHDLMLQGVGIYLEGSLTVPNGLVLHQTDDLEFIETYSPKNWTTYPVIDKIRCDAKEKLMKDIKEAKPEQASLVVKLNDMNTEAYVLKRITTGSAFNKKTAYEIKGRKYDLVELNPVTCTIRAYADGTLNLSQTKLTALPLGENLKANLTLLGNELYKLNMGGAAPAKK